MGIVINNYGFSLKWMLSSGLDNHTEVDSRLSQKAMQASLLSIYKDPLISNHLHTAAVCSFSQSHQTVPQKSYMYVIHVQNSADILVLSPNFIASKNYLDDATFLLFCITHNFV